VHHVIIQLSGELKMKFVEFESERLVFRKFNEADFPVVYSWYKDAENMSYRRDGTKTEEQTREHLRHIFAEANKVPCEDFWFAAVRKADNQLIGEGVIFHVPEKTELGWLVKKDFWQQGYGEEIGRALLFYSFDILNLHRVIATCHAENHASRRLMENIKMRQEARFIKARFHNGQWGDGFQFAMLQEEWKRGEAWVKC
jgi:RimJ/RimL family protein N-acetyltransferase